MIHKNIKLLTWFFFFLDFKLYFPILILYFAQITGSFALGMSIYSATLLAQAIFEVPTGIFSDLIGRKWTFILGAVCSFLAVLFYGLANSYLILLLGGILEGAARSFFSGTDQAIVHDSLKEIGKEEDFGKYQSKVGASNQLGLAFSSLLGAPAALFWSIRSLIWLSLLPQLVVLIICFFFIEPKVFTRGESNIFSHLKDSLNQFKSNKKLRNLTYSGVLRFAIGESSFLFRPAFYTSLWPSWAINLAGATTFLMAALGFHFASPLIKKFKEFQILVGEVWINRLINFVGLLFPNVLSPAIMTLTSINFGISQTALNSLLQKEFTDKQRATMGSLGSLLGNIVFALFAFLIGLIGDLVSPRDGLFILNFSMLVIIIFYWKIFKHPKTKNS